MLLRVGDAIAALIEVDGGPRTEHDGLAAAALAELTGRRDIAIRRRPSGRPRLDPPYPELGVSMAARGRHLAIGFSPTASVGVDIERLCSGIVADPHRMARDHFAGAEAEAVASLAGEAARALFLRIWVAKEAALKITGRGVYDGLRSPDLSGGLARLILDGAAVRARLSDAVEVAVATRAVATADGAHVVALAVAVPPVG